LGGDFSASNHGKEPGAKTSFEAGDEGLWLSPIRRGGAGDELFIEMDASMTRKLGKGARKGVAKCAWKEGVGMSTGAKGARSVMSRCTWAKRKGGSKSNQGGSMGGGAISLWEKAAGGTSPREGVANTSKRALGTKARSLQGETTQKLLRSTRHCSPGRKGAGDREKKFAVRKGAQLRVRPWRG